MSAAPAVRDTAAEFASAEWFRAVAVFPRPPAAYSTVGFRLELSDVPARLDVTVDLAGGELAIAPADTSPASLLFRLPAAKARTLLLGTSLDRARLLEVGDVVITGNFSLIFFIDAALQSDRAGRVAALRSLTRTAEQPAASTAPAEAAGRDGAAPSWTVGEAVRAALPRTSAELERELGSSSPGVQLFLSHHGVPVADLGLGLARPGVAMTADSWPLWYCCAKPLLVIALAQLWEQGRFDPYLPVAAYLPAFAVGGKQRVTSLQLLTHTGPLPTGADPLHGVVTGPDDVRRRLALELRVLPGSAAGARINYSQWWAWFVLAEVVQAIDGRSYEEYVAAQVLRSYGMDHTRVRLREAEFDEVGDRLPLIHVTNPDGRIVPTWWWSTRAAATRCIPGVNTRGPVRDQARMLEMLLADGRGAKRALAAPTVEALTARHRIGLTDDYGNADWGLGLRLECRHLGEPYTSFGSFTSARTFGHDGLWTAVAFADPEAEVVLAVHFNGKVEHSRHRRRILAVADSVYRDLRIARTP
jgi:CubicO group peptidase (beta-lactamase class C family)